MVCILYSNTYSKVYDIIITKTFYYFYVVATTNQDSQ